MKTNRRLIQLASVWVALLGGCAGELDHPSAPAPQLEEKVSFQSLIGQIPGVELGTATNQTGLDQGQEGAPVDKPPLELEAPLTVATVSRCHFSEHDNIMRTLNMFRNPGSGKFDKRFIVTLETDAGLVLGHLELDAEQLRQPAQGAAANVLHQIPQRLPLRLPAAMADQQQFRANLFACVDLNEDNACGDEGVAPMEGFDFKSDVVYFVPVQGRIAEGTVTLQALDEQQAAQATGGAAAQATNLMQNLLNNLAPGDVGLQAQANLSIVLTVSAVCPQPMQGVRTNGCFAAGTRVQIAPGKLALVEDLAPGDVLLTAGGKSATALRAVAGPEREPIIEISTAAGNRLRVTRTHPMLTSAGLKMAEALTTADRLLSADRQPVAITALNRRPYFGLVYNFALPGAAQADHLVVAEGLITGDLFLQQQLTAIPPK